METSETNKYVRFSKLSQQQFLQRY